MLKDLMQALLRRSGGGAAEPACADSTAEQRVDQALQRYQCGDAAAAKALCRAALALDQSQARAWSLLARIALEEDQLALALECYIPILAMHPDDPEYLVDAGELNRRAGHLSRAVELSERALALQPRDGRAWRVRRRALEKLGRLDEALDCLRHEMKLDPGNIVTHNDLLFMLNRSGATSAEQALAEHRAWAAAHADAFTAAARTAGNSAEPERVLRVGYISADFREHAVAYFVEPVLQFHDRTRFQVSCYFNWERSDAVTDRLRHLADHWRDIAGLSDDAAANLVREDGVDILIDLSGHTLGNRLLVFARKPAPIQMTWLGYLGTTGMQAMDYLITDACADPPGVADADYSETLLRLPHCRWCYQSPAQAPAVNELPAIARGFITYGSFNSFSKISGETLRAWGRLLRRVPHARLCLVGIAEAESCDRALETLEDEGVFADRIDAVGFLTQDAFLEQHRQIDVALDAYPYNGATTACHSLWMGVPVVSLCGRSGAARSGASILTNAGLAHLVAQSWDQYIDIAQGLAADVSALAQLRASLRGRLRASPLMDAPGFTRDLEALYRTAWRGWCARQVAARGGLC